MSTQEEIEDLIEQNELFRGQLEQAALILDDCGHSFAASKIRHLIYAEYPSRVARTSAPALPAPKTPTPPFPDLKRELREQLAGQYAQNRAYGLRKHKLHQPKEQPKKSAPRDVSETVTRVDNFLTQSQHGIGFSCSGETVVEIDEKDAREIQALIESPKKSEDDNERDQS